MRFPDLNLLKRIPLKLQAGNFLGVPVQFHLSFFLPLGAASLLSLVAPSGPTLLPILIFLTTCLIILLHEAGHATCAKLFGYPTKSITLSALGGLAYTPSLENAKPQEKLLVALAGPTTNLSIGILAYLLLGSPQGIQNLSDTLGSQPTWESFYSLMFTINSFLLFFNLLPIFPLDGGIILHCALQYTLKGKPNSVLAHKVYSKLFKKSYQEEAVPSLLMAATTILIGMPTAAFLFHNQAYGVGILLACLTIFGWLELTASGRGGM